MEEKVYQILYKRNIIQPLKGVLTTIEEGSVVKASEKLNKTQATITRQIQSLERDLGEALFNRNGKNLIPNEKGLRFYDIAIKRLEAMETLFADFLTSEKIEDDNTIRIAAHYGIISKFLPKYFKDFKEKNKNVKYEIYNINREDALLKLEKNEVDLVIYPKTKYNKSLYSKNIFSSDPILVLPKGHFLENKNEKNLTVDDIIVNNFISLNANMTFDFFKNTLLNLKYKSYLKLINCDWHIVKELAKQEIGITGIFDFFLEKDDKLIYKNLSHILPKMSIDVAIQRKNFIKPSLKKFLTLIDKNYFKNF